MHLLSRRAHGILDYAVGLFLIVAPRVFHLSAGPESRVLVWLGVAAIAYSLVTRYDFGAIKLLPFRVHLTLDVLHAMVLAVSPWLFAFSDHVWAPHLLLGLAELAVVKITRREPSVPPPLPGAPAAM